MNTDKIPLQIDHYIFTKVIGQGGMAQVCEYYDSRLNRSVAIKLTLSTFSHTPEYISRFEREVKTIAALEHNAIVPIYESGDYNGQPYFVMRRMKGGSLADHIRHNSITLENISVWLNRISSGLDYAHSKGFIHRDLKPSNILFDEHQAAYIADFGIAKSTSTPLTQLTQSGIAIGTAEYMSPEQAKGDSIDKRSDIYALGIILFELLTGNVPYKSESFTGVLIKQINEPVPKLKDRKKELPIALQKVIDKAMAKDPAMRYNSAGDLANDYARVISGKKAAQLQGANFLHNFFSTISNSSIATASGSIAMVLGLGILLAGFMWFLNGFSVTPKQPLLEKIISSTNINNIEPLKNPTVIMTSIISPAGGIVPTMIPTPTSTLFVAIRTEAPTQPPAITLPTSTSTPTPTHNSIKTPESVHTPTPMPLPPTAIKITQPTRTLTPMLPPQPTLDRSGWFFSPHPSVSILSLRRERLLLNSYQNGFAVWFSNSNTTYVLANGRPVMSSVGYIDNVVVANTSFGQTLGNKLNSNDYVGCAGHTVIGSTTTGYISTPNHLVLSWAVQNGGFTGWRYENVTSYIGC